MENKTAYVGRTVYSLLNFRRGNVREVMIEHTTERYNVDRKRQMEARPLRLYS